MKRNSLGQFLQKVPIEELIGKKFGKLRVKSVAGIASNGTAIYNCLCKCGNKTKTRKGRLLSGETISCGCVNIIDLKNRVFGRLKVKKRMGKTKCGNYRWLCECSCGNTLIVKSGSLIRKNGTRSCGCILNEISIKRLTTHGLVSHPLYSVWMSMKQRCADKEDEVYGGRGISVCQEWKEDFKPFYTFAIREGWNIGLEIDRKNTNGNYTPGNCRFVKRTINCQNTRRSKHWIINGNTYPCAREAAEGEGVHITTIYQWCGVAGSHGRAPRVKTGCSAVLKYGEQP